jgi:putative membrane protein
MNTDLPKPPPQGHLLGRKPVSTAHGADASTKKVNSLLRSDPDPRFTFANERTFLAWNRTGLALIGGGLALAGLITGTERLLGIPLIVFGALLALGSYHRWQTSAEALRRGDPIPATALPHALTYAVIATAAAAIALAALR